MYSTPSPPRAGDVRRVRCGALSRLVYVMRIPSTKRRQGHGAPTANIALIHTYIEYATSSDRVVDSIVSGLTYPVVIQFDKVGAVFLSQLDDTRVTHLFSGDVANAPCGSCVSGSFDARTLFKQNELVELHAIVAYCTAQALDRS